MKIKINESQLKRIVKHLPLNEVGGYDSKDLMGFHGGMVQGEITFLISRFVSKMEQVMDYMHSEEVTKENLQKGLLFINDEIEGNIKRLGELTSEVYFDDDFRQNYLKGLAFEPSLFNLDKVGLTAEELVKELEQSEKIANIKNNNKVVFD